MNFDLQYIYIPYIKRNTREYDSNNLSWIPDKGYKIYIPVEHNFKEIVFKQNKIFCCISSCINVPFWIISDKNIELIFQYSYKEFVEHYKLIKNKYYNLPQRKELYLSDCSVEDIINNQNYKEFLKNFENIIILNENSKGRLMPSVSFPIHQKRRRPCRYPFEYLSVDLEGNIYQCPYSNHCITKIRQFEEIYKSTALMHFLASQLILDLNAYPCCKKCNYWLDGWLGDEINIIKREDGKKIKFFLEGHYCRISMKRI